MSTILIRRGAGTPPIGQLASNELGWDTLNNVLYIGVDGQAPIQISQASQSFLVIDQVTGTISVSTSIDTANLISTNATIGVNSTDLLTVNASSIFNSPVTINSTLLTTGLSSLNGGIEVGSNFSVDTAGALYAGSTINAVGNISTLGDLDAVNLTLSGNLTVQGTTTTINSTVTTIADPVITLGESLAVNDNKDRGTSFNYGSTAIPTLGYYGYNASTGRFTYIPQSVNTNETFSGNAGDVEFGEIYQTQTNNVYDPLGVTVNASALWNAAANAILNVTVNLTELPIQICNDVLITTYSFAYNPNFVQVFLNRLKLRADEYAATDGTTVTILYPLNIGDEIEIITASVQ